MTLDIKWKSAHTIGFSLILKKNPRLLAQSTRTKPHFAPPTTLARSPAAHTNSILLPECTSLLQVPATSALHMLVPSARASFPEVAGCLASSRDSPLPHKHLANTSPTLPVTQRSHLHTSSTCPHLSTLSSFARYLASLQWELCEKRT